MHSKVLQRYRTCKISDEYTGLILDGAWYRFRQLYGPKRVVLAVLGVKADGVVVLLGFHVARSESALEVGRILRDLKSRGLAGRNLKILVGSWRHRGGGRRDISMGACSAMLLASVPDA